LRVSHQSARHSEKMDAGPHRGGDVEGVSREKIKKKGEGRLALGSADFGEGKEIKIQPKLGVDMRKTRTNTVKRGRLERATLSKEEKTRGQKVDHFSHAKRKGEHRIRKKNKRRAKRGMIPFLESALRTNGEASHTNQEKKRRNRKRVAPIAPTSGMVAQIAAGKRKQKGKDKGAKKGHSRKKKPGGPWTKIKKFRCTHGPKKKQETRFGLSGGEG